MRSVVVYESMYGNTHLIADAIAAGLRDLGEVDVLPVGDASREVVEAADLVVVGGPTHAHSMSRPSTRQGAVDALAKPDSDLELDPDAAGIGVREWLESSGSRPGMAAAFDTRIDMPPVLTGRASKGIAKKLRHHGFDVIAPPESFLVTKESHLEPGEEARARAWGLEVGSVAASGRVTNS